VTKKEMSDWVNRRLTGFKSSRTSIILGQTQDDNTQCDKREIKITTGMLKPGFLL